MRIRSDICILLTLLGALVTPGAGWAQSSTAHIQGRVLDAETGRPLPGAQVRVDGTPLGTLAGAGGRYILRDVPAGAGAVTASYIGYAEKRITGVEIEPGQTSALDIALVPRAIAVQGITVSAERERGSVGRALHAQRTAVGVTSAVTAEDISRTGDGDAAAASQRVSGVTVQDGKYVSVRGLGERYTTASLNGARIPSPEPERRVVPLDLFPSGLLQTVTTSKTFTPNLSGDFSGAQVDIRTREFPSRRNTTLSASVGYRPGITGQSVLVAPGTGGEMWALAGQSRDLPEAVAAWGRFENSPGQAEINRMVNAFRNAWTARSGTAAPPTSFSVSSGGTETIFQRQVGYLASATYSQGQEARLDEVRSSAIAGAEGRTQEVDRFEGSTGQHGVLWGGVLNLSILSEAGTRISLNNTYNRSADHDARRESGFSENLRVQLQVDRLRYVERSVRSTQLTAEHQIGDRKRLDWSLSSSAVGRREPDRSEVVYVVEDGLPPVWAGDGNQGAVRTFGDLGESALEGTMEYRHSFGPAGRPLELRIGTLARWTQREAENRAYSISARGGSTVGSSRQIRELAPEEIFDGRFSGPEDAEFRVAPLGQGGSYTARDALVAGFGMAEIPLGRRASLVVGARLEHSLVEVEAEPTVRAAVRTAPRYTDVLPSFTLNVRLTDQQNLRLAASQTLSRPEYRELAPVQYREVIGGEDVIGNADLRRTLVQNLDARWEWYPGPGGIVSVALFAKRFQDPIERVYLAGSGTRLVTFVNADGAENYGLELELRRQLGSVVEVLSPLSIFANATLMRSEIRIGDDVLASRTNANRPMVGQAPYVFNTGLTYATDGGRTSGTLLYNVVGPRIVVAAGAPLPDAYEQPRHALDLSLRLPLPGEMTAKLDVKNLLDAPHQVLQGPVTREFYRTGRSISLGASWQH